MNPAAPGGPLRPAPSPPPRSACWPQPAEAFVCAWLDPWLPHPQWMTPKEPYPGTCRDLHQAFDGWRVRLLAGSCLPPLDWFQRVLSLQRDIQTGAPAPWGGGVWRQPPEQGGQLGGLPAPRPISHAAHPSFNEEALLLSILYIGTLNEASPEKLVPTTCKRRERRKCVNPVDCLLLQIGS